VPRPALPEGPYLVVGLARSGVAAARVLRAHGEVIGCDTGRPDGFAELEGEGVEVHANTAGVDLLDRARTVVKSPGVPQVAAVVRAARERGVRVVGELEVAWRLLPNEFLAVTGTNGKTTTVELLGAMHRAAGLSARVAGNVGTAAASLVGAIAPEATVVCEASSFQLEDAEAFAPDCAVLLNVTPDHLDRHGSVEAYRAAKQRIFARQGPGHISVTTPALKPSGRARWVSFGSPDADLALEDGRLSWEGEPLMAAAEVRLRGAHNLENAMAAAAAALSRGVSPDPVREALSTFAGVPHRLEEVARTGGVLWVNDSKATNPDSARVGIESFSGGGVHVILGGQLKGGDFGSLRAPLQAHCRAAYLIGDAAERLEIDLEGAGVPLERCGDLEAAVRGAAKAARAEEIVLLSPACASWDQYGSYEERGAHFRSLVAELGEDER
jgi:UDP-N-acetylmuramoylalanine--D-glutamate ligase